MPEEPTLFEKARQAPVTFGLAALDVVVFVLLEAKDSTVQQTGIVTLLQVGANQRSHVWAGEYWRLATYMFLHIGWLHLAWNIYASVGFCAAVERALGKGRFLAVYLASGIAGGCLSVLFAPSTSAGASGALFGVVGAMLAIRRRQLPSFSAFFKDRATRSTLFNIAIWTFIGTFALRMDNAAHFGGLMMGFGLTWTLTSRRPLVEWVTFGLVSGAMLVLATRVVGPTPRPDDLRTMTTFGYAYLTGSEGFPKNDARARRFFARACHFGDSDACALSEAEDAQRVPRTF